jgi:hypothetical protein
MTMPPLLIAAVTFDWSISLGQIVNALMVLGGGAFVVFRMFHALDKRVSEFEFKIETHAETLKDHATRMERWESTLFKVVSDLSHVLGRLEVRQHESQWDGRNRRTDPRNRD